ncbi:hypothetical protein, partial [Mesorhizobium sp. M7A.F.Ca.AU.002.06.1.1]
SAGNTRKVDMTRIGITRSFTRSTSEALGTFRRAQRRGVDNSGAAPPQLQRLIRLRIEHRMVWD